MLRSRIQFFPASSTILVGGSAGISAVVDTTARRRCDMSAGLAHAGDYIVMVQKSSPRPGTINWTYWIAEEGADGRRGPFDTLPPAVVAAKRLAAFAGTRAWRSRRTPEGEVVLEALPVG
jgi:hypothetical protein